METNSYFEGFLSRMNSEVSRAAKPFHLELNHTVACKALDVAYRTQVMKDHGEVDMSEPAYLDAIRFVAAWLTKEEGRKVGLLLNGGVGLGKTVMLRAMSSLIKDYTQAHRDDELKPLTMPIRGAKQIANMYRDNPQEFEQLRYIPLLAIDDLGKESEKVKVYGNEGMPLVDLIEERYEMRNVTVITTNLSYNPYEAADHDENKELTRLYGERVVDRLRQYSFYSFGFDRKTYRL